MGTVSQHSARSTNSSLRYGTSFLLYSGPTAFVCDSERVVLELKSRYPTLDVYCIRMINKTPFLSGVEIEKILQKAKLEIAAGTFSNDDLRYFAEKVILQQKNKQNRPYLKRVLNGSCLSAVVNDHKSKNTIRGLSDFLLKNGYGQYN